MSTQKSCDHCGLYRQNVDGSPAVHRYTLRSEVVGWRKNGNRSQISRGGIDLCDDCWKKIAAPNMNRNKSHKRETA
jgi:hypothetical protein